MTLLFLFKLTLCWAFFALLYGLLLRDETFFRANRTYLLGTLVLGILLALDLHWWPAESLPLVVLPTFTVDLQRAEEATRSWLFRDYLWLAYGLGAGFFLLRFGWAFGRLLSMAVRSRAETLPDGCLLLRSSTTPVPFSFFKWIFVPEEYHQDATETDRTAMLLHERAHARGWHSADVLVLELLCAVFWFHPLIHWYRRSLRNVHEYLADAEASRSIDLKQYGLLLIRQSQSGIPVALVHHFFQSPLKQRFIMLTKKASAPRRGLKYGLLLPATVLFALLFRQAPAIAQQIDPHVQHVRYLEAHNWIESDTVSVYDTETQKETVSVVSRDAGPFRDKTTGRQVYQVCEKMPEYPGGPAAMMQFLASNLHYPPEGRANKQEGMVLIRFIVGADGTLRSIGEKQAPAGLPAIFSDEAKRVVALMPKWAPGEHNGKKVDCEMLLPIKFKLN